MPSTCKLTAPRWFSALFLLMFFVPRVSAQSTTLVISQAYGGGGSSNALYSADFVEIFNKSGATQSLAGYAVQYISTGGSVAASSGLIPLPNVSLAPGQRFLVTGAGSCSAVGCIPLPTGDLNNTSLAASGSAGRLYLTSINTALAQATPACPTTGIIDYIGYGSGVGCNEGGTGKQAPATTTTKVDVRNDPCVDTDNNLADFSALDPGVVPPRTMSSVATPCGGGTTTTPISITAAANPISVYQNATTLLTVSVTPGTNPASTGVTVNGDLSAFGGSSAQPFYDDGTHGDTASGDGIFSYTLSVSGTAPLGANTIAVSAADTQVRTATASIALTVLAQVTLVPIHTIQGSTPGTAAYNGQTVMTSGIVIGVRTNGFFLQARDIDADTNPATPEGIFVHTGTGLVPSTATLGTNMQVAGTVALFPTTGPLPNTEIDSPSAFTVLSTGNPLPTAITLTTTNPSPTGGFSQLQRYQSMRIAVPSFTVTGPTDGALDEVNETYTSTGQFWGTVTGSPRPVREPGLEILDPLTASQPSTIPRFDDNPELFQVDSVAMVPTPGPLDLSTGALLTNLSGVFDFAGGTPVFDIDAATRPAVTAGMTVTPVSVAAAGEVTIGDQNLERFYNTVKGDTFGHNGDVAVTATAYALRLAKASLAIRNVMRTPDILAVEEMESIGNLNDLSAKISADAIAAGQTDPHYAGYLIDGNDVGVINVGFLVNPSKVTVVSVVQYGKATTKTGNSTLLNDRPPLVLHAGVKRTGTTDYPLTIIVNHLRSLQNVTDPTSTGDNIRTKREQQAEFLANLAQTFQVAGEHVIVVGDLNTFEFNDGLVDSFGILKGSAAPANQDVVAGTSGLVTPNLVDMAPTNLAKGDYSYSFAGNAQTLDHFLVTQDIASITRTAAAHVNADFPAVYRNDATRPEVGSDHDGIVGYIKVPGGTVISVTPPSLTFASQVLKTTTSQNVVIKNSGTSAITITSVSLGGGASANFSVPASPCGASLAAGASCTVAVSFTPTVTGPITGTLVFTDSDVTGTQTVNLTGTGAGIFSAITLAPTTASIVAGNNFTFTATATGNAGVTPTGTVSFLDGTTTLKSGAVLTNGVATFSTTTLAVGARSITAVYSGDATYPTTTSTASIITVAPAPVPDFTFAVGNAQLIATSGQPISTTTLHVGMVNGFSTSVSFSCSGLPAATRCTFSPATLSATGDSVLTIGIDNAAVQSPFEQFNKTGSVLAFGLVMLPFLMRRKVRTSLRNATRLMALLLLAGGIAAMSGCSGGGSAPATPPGTSSITVTATGGSVTHAATFSLKVQ